MKHATGSRNSAYGIHWFRRDLKVVGNPALQWSWKEHAGRVLGVFFFDPEFIARPDFSRNRFAFFLETLAVLQAEMRAAGGDLLVLDRGPDQGFERLVSALQQRGMALPRTCSFNRDYEPFARERDSRLTSLLETRWGIDVHSERDHLLIEPDELRKGNEEKSWYQVYTPFSRKWFEILGSSDEVRDRITLQKKAIHSLDRVSKGRAEPVFELKWPDLFGGRLPESLSDQLGRYRDEAKARTTVSLPEAGARAALARLRDFKRNALEDYGEGRDFPDRDGTSRLSVYLKNGSITATQVIAELGLDTCTVKEQSSRAKFLKELVWREFYYHILYHYPRVEKHSFNPKFEKLKWQGTDAHFEAWKEGRTGYPIVDAGMRQLRATGWMHNRVRMIVASFLTKDLLISWQRGERYFMEQLLDGDLAPNNGGWQWAASTGCDPQPYFRIFNPKLQSERFDPNGEYIRKYIPELRGLDMRHIHEPGDRRPSAYPAPIVDHARQKARALAMYTANSSGS